MNRRNVLRAQVAVGAAAALGGAASVAAAAEPRSAGKQAGPLRVHVVMYEGVEELDFAAPYEVFSAARFFTDREVDVRYVSASGPGPVRAAYGTQVNVEHAWAPRTADILLVPGGGYARRDSPGVWAEIRSGVLPGRLAAAVRPGLTVSAVCTGTMLLAAAGLTTKRPCTTHHKARPDLEKQGGLLKNARVVDDGDLVTAGGITSGLDLALWLVRRELGADAATGVEAMLEYEARGTVWTPPTAGRP
ncbi:thimanine synthesis protein ThiJ [Streptomyces nojiriensis]|uniref:Thimanine synthesis protein ThiJ n=1 Tax=Streptomyces nojiriensis TaxID=66374 RepID=A0ABQ3SJ26_9ACTN|nr:DJ-1/PfpI family protein [Streptomyces nojiriensis]QTI49685.1 Isonitrile hydratase [Streptomyces nojiriensis]GGS23761.1 thimanine synthesis protein ThiJ [Streptomyces nojiriensis]GHI68074.1 thimanine synthesis protein ThiJ [Streptomyces nojiriensis]